MPGLKLSLVIGAVAPLATALLVAPNSPCAQQCGNVLTGDSGDDMTCSEEAYSTTAAGMVFENCINCQLSSRYAAQNQTDLQWMLYNLRFATSWCLWGFPGNSVASTPCITSFACGPLMTSIQWDNLTTAGGAYDYCQDWSSAAASRCQSCLRPAEEGDFLANFFVILDAACQQRPAVGSVLSLQGSTPFTTVPVIITTPPPTVASLPTPDYGAVSLGARVGIAIGGLAFILALAGFCIVMNGKRRRRRFLRELARRHAAKGGGGGGGGGGQGQDMFETPLSQKSLRSWDDSPLSAHTVGTDRTLPRHFSLYSSQYQQRRLYLADEGKKGKEREEYELVEGPWSGQEGNKVGGSAPRMPAEPQTPVTHHPGHGRHPPSRMGSKTGSAHRERAGEEAMREDGI